MIIETKLKEGIKIIKLSGEVNFDNYLEFGESLLRSIQGSENIILDMDGLTYLNSMGLSAIVKAYSKARRDERELKLASLKENIEKLFVITKLNRLIDICDTVESAVQSYHKK
ncbi:MAG: STAS domain-containing protein [Bacillota bacterium]